MAEPIRDTWIGYQDSPKPKLCVCGHPATSHNPVYEKPHTGAGPLCLIGICREAHPNGPYPCWGFKAPEDVKRESMGPQGSIGQCDGGPVGLPGPRGYVVGGKPPWSDIPDGKDMAPRGFSGAGSDPHEVCEKRMDYRDGRIAELERQIAELEKWKREAMSVMPDYQAIAKELGLKLGDTVHDKILPALVERRVDAEDAYRDEQSVQRVLKDTSKKLGEYRFTFGLPEAAARNELAAVRLFFGLKNDESIMEHVRRIFTGK